MTFRDTDGNSSGGNRGAMVDDVAENLGLTAEDLGADPSEDALGSDSDITPEDMGVPGPDDEGDVSHSRTQREAPQRGQQRQPEPKLRTFNANAEVRADAKGNLYNKDGVIVAKAGREARLYQDGHRARQAANSAAEQARSLAENVRKAVTIGQEIERELNDYKAREQQITDLGLSREENLQALQLASQFKREPVAALKQMIAMAAAGGIDLSAIGMQGGAGVFDAKTLGTMITQHLDQRLNPITEAQTRQQQAEQQNREVQQAQERVNNETINFFRQNPEARNYHHVFTALYEDPRFSNMSLQHAWDKIQLQLERARINGAGRNPPPNVGQRRPLPNSRNAGAARFDASEDDGSSLSGMAPVTSSYEQIARDVAKILGNR